MGLSKLLATSLLGVSLLCNVSNSYSGINYKYVIKEKIIFDKQKEAEMWEDFWCETVKAVKKYKDRGIIIHLPGNECRNYGN